MEAQNDLNRLECWAFTKWEVGHLAEGSKQSVRGKEIIYLFIYKFLL